MKRPFGNEGLFFYAMTFVFCLIREVGISIFTLVFAAHRNT